MAFSTFIQYKDLPVRAPFSYNPVPKCPRLWFKLVQESQEKFQWLVVAVSVWLEEPCKRIPLAASGLTSDSTIHSTFKSLIWGSVTWSLNVWLHHTYMHTINHNTYAEQPKINHVLIKLIAHSKVRTSMVSTFMHHSMLHSKWILLLPLIDWSFGRLFSSTLTYKKGGQMTSQLEVKGEFF